MKECTMCMLKEDEFHRCVWTACPNNINTEHEEKPTHGGKRKGSGAKSKYGEATTTVAFRVPKSKVDAVKKIVKDYLDSL